MEIYCVNLFLSRNTLVSPAMVIDRFFSGNSSLGWHLCSHRVCMTSAQALVAFIVSGLKSALPLLCSLCSWLVLPAQLLERRWRPHLQSWESNHTLQCSSPWQDWLTDGCGAAQLLGAGLAWMDPVPAALPLLCSLHSVPTCSVTGEKMACLCFPRAGMKDEHHHFLAQ